MCPIMTRPIASTTTHDAGESSPEFAFNRRRDDAAAITAPANRPQRVEQVASHGLELAVHPRQPRQPYQPHRSDRQGRDLVLRENKQVTEFRGEGCLLPCGRCSHPVALCFDDGARRLERPDVMFRSVIQRVLEVEGKLTLLYDQNRGHPPAFTRRSACSRPPIRWGWATPPASITARSRSTRGQMSDRWNIVATLNYLPHDAECNIVLQPRFRRPTTTRTASARSARWSRSQDPLTRSGFINGDISTVMSPRTVMTWAENARIFNDLANFAFRLTFLSSKCDEIGTAGSGRRILSALLRHRIARDRRQSATLM